MGLGVKSLPIVRKVLRIGDSKGVSFPKSWIDYFEETKGQKMEEVIIEVNGSLVITPRLNDRGFIRPDLER